VQGLPTLLQANLLLCNCKHCSDYWVISPDPCLLQNMLQMCSMLLLQVRPSASLLDACSVCAAAMLLLLYRSLHHCHPANLTESNNSRLSRCVDPSHPNDNHTLRQSSKHQCLKRIAASTLRLAHQHARHTSRIHKTGVTPNQKPAIDTSPPYITSNSDLLPADRGASRCVIGCEATHNA